MSIVWKAKSEVVDLLQTVKEKNHERLFEASVAIAFNDAKAFSKNRFRWGSASKFTPQAKLWQNNKFDFQIILPSVAWEELLVEPYQREAWLDLHITRFRAEMMPAMAENEKGKMKPVKDKYGRISFSDEVKLDNEGNVVWVVDKLDLHVFADNFSRYGSWCEEVLHFEEVINKANHKNQVIIADAEVEFHPN